MEEKSNAIAYAEMLVLVVLVTSALLGFLSLRLSTLPSPLPSSPPQPLLPEGVPPEMRLVISGAALAAAETAVELGIKAEEIVVRQRLDGHYLERHGLRAAAALLAVKSALRALADYDLWFCPPTRRGPASLVILVPDEAGVTCAVGVISLTPRPTGEYVLLSVFFCPCLQAERKCLADGCTKIPRVIKFILLW